LLICVRGRMCTPLTVRVERGGEKGLGNRGRHRHPQAISGWGGGGTEKRRRGRQRVLHRVADEYNSITHAARAHTSALWQAPLFCPPTASRMLSLP
jgi:hypothetical protein